MQASAPHPHFLLPRRPEEAYNYGDWWHDFLKLRKEPAHAQI
jgi:hypothetical protein